MRNLHTTNTRNWSATFARLAVSIAVFPHGAQKLLGWFGGAGFQKSMDFFVNTVHLPWIIGFLVILIEFFGAIFLFIGWFTRAVSFLFVLNFSGIVYTSILGNGFFMNWGMQEGKGEGYEYFVLLFVLLFILLISGGGRFSVDAARQKKDLY